MTIRSLEQLFPGDSEMARRMREHDWSRTSLGPVEGWPEALRTVVSTSLNCAFPIVIWWGPELTILYNDEYREFLGPKKHPAALGEAGAKVWAEIWEVVGPMLGQVMERGEATRSRDLMLHIDRGFPEETYFSFSYSPIHDENGKISGIFCPVLETTDKIIGERRLRTLRDLASECKGAETEAAAYTAAAMVLAENPRDVPFAMIYRVDEATSSIRLDATAGIEPGSSAAPPEISLEGDGDDGWSLRAVARSGRQMVIDDLASRYSSLPTGAWDVQARCALVLPVLLPGQERPRAILVAGVSPMRALDQPYRTFFGLVATQIASALADAQAREDERRRAEALAEIDRAKTAFFSNVSHEFRTPLTLMLGPQEDALASPDGVLAGETLRVVHRNTLRLLKLVNALLTFSRSEAGRIQASYAPTDLSALTRDLASAFRSTIERGGLRFEVDCAELTEPVYVDRDLWEKIVLNLLSNAFKFTLEGSVAVRLRRAGSHVELDVEDSGVGIPERELGKVFERFHRIEGVRARTYEGSGIGLALVRDLARLHGGDARVTSVEGRGTTFTVSIPFGFAHLQAERIAEGGPLSGSSVSAEPFVQEALRWAPAAEDRTAEAPQAGAPTLIGADRRVRILVADDNADMRGYVTRLLRSHWTVESVADGAQALERVKSVPPDLLLTDVMMPSLDGFGLIRAIRADASLAHIPIIVLSARAGDESRIDGLAVGADDYLVKPFSAKELIARVHVHLENARLRRAVEGERNQLRELLGQVPAIVNFLRGPELTFEFAHPMTVALLGGRDLVGKPLLEVLPEFHEQEFPALLRRVMETGERIDANERLARIAGPDGELRDSYWNSVYLPVRRADGRIDGVMTFDLDVTDQVLARRSVEEHSQKLAEANLEAERARALAEKANLAKDEFLAMLGHEMRNPLAPIITSLRLMRMKGLDSREQQVIERQVDGLVRLVDDLLDTSRITRGMIEIKKVRLQLGQAVLQGIETASPLIEARKQHVDLKVASGMEIIGDSERLAQVVSNLVTNAAKYSAPGTTIHIEGAPRGTSAVLRVRDEGIGIAAEMLAHVFEPFVQQRQTLDRSKGGLGLGLAIVRSFVELHGGTVTAMSAGVGKGSEFVVELPLAPPLEELDEVGSADISSGVAAIRPATPGRRVLVVDDNEDVAGSLAGILGEYGYEVLTVHDGPSALSVVESFKPDVCLIDIGLPVMDGYELAKLLRASKVLPVDARIVAITGYGQEADRLRSVDAGFHAHLVKPVDLDVLTKLLN